MDKLVIQRETGFPVQKRTFDFLQQAYGSAIGHLCRVYGDNIILYGVELVGGSLTAGAVIIDGELLPFEKSPDAPHIEVVETSEDALYQGGERLPAYITRVARSAATGGVSLADLRRIKPEATEWVNIGATSTNITVIRPIRIRINEQGRVQLDGSATITGRDLPQNRFHFSIPFAFVPRVGKVVSSAGMPLMGTPFPLVISADGAVRIVYGQEDIGLSVTLNGEYEL